jgi:hypothetical protein
MMTDGVFMVLRIEILLCQAQDNATSCNVSAPYATFPSNWWLHCAANACGVSPSRAPWGRS